MKLTKQNVKLFKAPYQPKAILILVDEMSEVMNDSNYKMVNSIQTSLGSIARLGRAAGVHLCLATQRPSSNVINADLKNNIQMGCLLGDFDSGASTLIFDKDISAMSKPEIKGRGFLKSGKEIYEFQSYWTEKEKHFTMRDSVSSSDNIQKIEERNIDDVISQDNPGLNLSKPEKKYDEFDASQFTDSKNESKKPKETKKVAERKMPFGRRKPQISEAKKPIEPVVRQEEVKIDNEITPTTNDNGNFKSLEATAFTPEPLKPEIKDVKFDEDDEFKPEGYEEIDVNAIAEMIKKSKEPKKNDDGFEEISVDEIIKNINKKKLNVHKTQMPTVLEENGVRLKLNLKKDGGK